MKQIKRYRFWYIFFLVLGAVGLFDAATKSLVQQQYNIVDIGYASIGFLLAAEFIFGTDIALLLYPWVSIIPALSVAWFIPAYYFNKKMKLIEDPSIENTNAFKRAKIVSCILAGIVFLLIAIGFYFGVSS